MWWCKTKNIDYKERWLAAVALLGETGRLTPEEVLSISGGQSLQERVEAVKVSQAMTTTLRNMKSWDRAALEVSRAKQHKPPIDDLEGMKSWDVAAVLAARMRYGTTQ